MDDSTRETLRKLLDEPRRLAMADIAPPLDLVAVVRDGLASEEIAQDASGVPVRRVVLTAKGREALERAEMEARFFWMRQPFREGLAVVAKIGAGVAALLGVLHIRGCIG